MQGQGECFDKDDMVCYTSLMDLNKLIKLHQGDKYIELPLVNLLRLTLVELKELMQEYRNIDPNITKFWDWLLHVKLGVKVGDSILK